MSFVTPALQPCSPRYMNTGLSGALLTLESKRVTSYPSLTPYCMPAWYWRSELQQISQVEQRRLDSYEF